MSSMLSYKTKESVYKIMTQMLIRATSRIGLAKAVSIVAFLTIISKILGFAREMSLAAVFGATAVTDAFIIAQTIPYLLFSTISYALTTTFIPVYSHVREERGQSAAHLLANSVIWTTSSMALLFVVSGELLAMPLVRLVAPGFDGSIAELTAYLSRILFPMMVFQLLSGILTGMLQADGEFTIPTAASLLQNLAIIVSIVFFGVHKGIGAVAIGSLMGTVMVTLAIIPVVWRSGFRLTGLIDLRDTYLKRMAFLMLPAVLGAGANQINTLVSRILASGLPEGRIAALSYANKITGLALSIIGVSIITVVYPSLARIASRREWDRFGEGLVDALNMVCFMLMPIAVGVLVLRMPLVQIIYERGAFDASATKETAWALLFLSIGIAFFAMRDLVSRAFFALQDTTTPMILGILTVGVNVVLNLLLIRPLEQGGLALANSFASIVGLILGLVAFRNKLPFGLPIRRLLSSQLRTVCASVVMGVFVWVLYHRMLAIMHSKGSIMHLFCLIFVSGVGAFIFFGLAKMLRIPETRIILEVIAKVRTSIFTRFKVPTHFRHP